MLQFLRSTNRNLTIALQEDIKAGTWIRSERPSDDEKALLLEIGIDEDILADALDPHEVPRVELDHGWTYFITRLPDTDDEFNDFTTPILFAMGDKYIVTISRDPLGRLWQPFIEKVTSPTTQKTKFFILMMETIVLQYQNRIARINRQMRATTDDVQKLNLSDIAKLTEQERKLNDYLDALIPTNAAIEKLLGGKLLSLYDDDAELVEDLSVDLEQIISRCKSILRTIKNVRDSYRAVADTRLNETVQLLTVLTVTLTIPTMIAGIYGMNVPIPGQGISWMFWAIIGFSLLVAFALGLYFLRRR